MELPQIVKLVWYVTCFLIFGVASQLFCLKPNIFIEGEIKITLFSIMYWNHITITYWNHTVPSNKQLQLHMIAKKPYPLYANLCVPVANCEVLFSLRCWAESTDTITHSFFRTVRLISTLISLVLESTLCSTAGALTRARKKKRKHRCKEKAWTIPELLILKTTQTFNTFLVCAK